MNGPLSLDGGWEHDWRPTHTSLVSEPEETSRCLEVEFLVTCFVGRIVLPKQPATETKTGVPSVFLTGFDP